MRGMPTPHNSMARSGLSSASNPVYVIKPTTGPGRDSMTTEPVTANAMSFHCRCGHRISTGDNKVICDNCGETVEVIGCKDTAHGKKYSLRISHQHREWNPQPAMLAWRPRTEQRSSKAPRDQNRRYVRLGLLILFAPIYLPLVFVGLTTMIHLQKQQSLPANAAIMATPRPDDCGISKGCYYLESYIYDEQTGRWVEVWERKSFWNF